MPTEAYKRCTDCGETKPLDDFHRHRREASGRQIYCKACHCRHQREWRESHMVKRAEAQRLYRRRNPLKARARKAVSNAVERGKLVKPDQCEGCGEPTEARFLDGHHTDYSKPLDVAWLCRTCHAETHQERVG